jgi:hypothetical protein
MNVRFDNPFGSGDQSLSAPIVVDGLKTTNPNGNNCANDTATTPNGTGAQAALTFKQTYDPTTPTPYTKYDSYCNASPVIGSCPLPRDRTFTQAGGKAWASVLVGSGPNTADLQAYWKNHHAGSLPAGMDTRYKIYSAEADGSAPFTAASDAKEPHAPACKKSTVSDADRRLIHVAIVDCDYWGTNGRKQLPITTLTAKFFMTEPADVDGSIYAEMVGTSQINAEGSSIYQIVQLVR